tara:strand:+ start:209 stop:1330 length:1122 start_codon:yes stop_codon:yes gene_type:complete
MAITKVSTAVVDMSGNTEGLVIAKGNDAQRPVSPSIGMIRDNTETTPSKLEVYNSTGWQYLKVGSQPLSISYLCVAGGGAGGSYYYGGGGGAGGFLDGEILEAPSSFTITVGNGGSGSGNGQGGNGGNSSIVAAEITDIISIGGGGGGGSASYSSSGKFGKNGGSGGGVSGFFQTNMAEGLGTAGQGFMSGSSWTSSVNYVNPVFNSSTYLGSAWGSGGGGASERGHHSYWATDNALPGAGGDGLASNITGTSTYYAGGGGGGFNANSGNNFGPYGSPGRAPGGLGGGGAGARGWFSSTQAIAGTANTGGGGGAGSHTSAAAGKNGGSGIVILKYPDTYSSTKTGSLISSVSTAVSGYKIETFTSGTGTITFA